MDLRDPSEPWFGHGRNTDPAGLFVGDLVPWQREKLSA